MRPRPGQRTPAEVADFYDTWTPRFVATFGTTLQAGLVKESAGGREDAATSARLLADRAGVRDGDRVLDAGCGVGGPAAAIAAHHPRCRIDGVTVSRVQAEAARGVLHQAGVADRVAVLRADYHSLCFRADAFDVALFLESCGYSADRHRLFAEAARVVRPGGAVYVKDVFAPSALTVAQRHDLRRFDDTWHLATSPTLDDVAAALQAAGCEIERRGEVPDVGNASFAAALVEPDPDTLLRLNDLGRRFAVRAADLPLFFGEVLGRVR